MLKKTIKYTDYNDVEREEDFYFNLTKSEIMEMQLTTEGGLAERIQKIAKTVDVPSLTKLFKGIILKSYGEKSDDGKRFIKSEELSEAFSQTEAYDVLFMELMSDDEAASNFILGVAPKEIVNSDDFKLAQKEFEVK